MRAKPLVVLLMTATLFAAPVLAQSHDLVGVLRQDGVALLLFQWTPQGFAHTSRTNAAPRYFVRTGDGRRVEVAAESPVDLSDDDHIWGQRTDFGPVIAESNEYPIPRSHYLVTDTTGDAAFQLVEETEPDSGRLDALLDALGVLPDAASAPPESRKVWRATLDGDSTVFFHATRPVRNSDGVCFGVAGWLAGTASGSLQVVDSGDDGCDASPSFHPWAVIRRGDTLFALVERLGPGISRPQLWQRGSDGTWIVVLG